MKSKNNQIKSAFIACILCFTGLFFNSCQTSEDEVFIISSELYDKDSKIVALFFSALGGTEDIASTSFKSFTDDQQCTSFIYPITFYAYSSDADEPAPVVINNDEEFISFLESLTNGQQFFITYPVTIVDLDGNETVIRDYPDLEGILTMLVEACQGDSDDGDDDGDDDDGDGDDGDGDDGDGDDIDYEYCGNGKNKNKKVVICHKGQTICISINAIWGHMAHHSEDYFGSCNN